MKKYFTKPYIKECDCEEIQNLRKNYWVYGDYISLDGQKPRLILTEVENILGDEIFIPRSDQLDEEIIKICDERRLHYIFTYIRPYTKYKNSKKIFKLYEGEIKDCDDFTHFYINKDNPLIAKIRLLKELLNDN